MRKHQNARSLKELAEIQAMMPKPKHLPRFAREWLNSLPEDFDDRRHCPQNSRVWKFADFIDRDHWVSQGPQDFRAAGFREALNRPQVQNDILRAERRHLAKSDFPLWTPQPGTHGEALPTSDEITGFYLKRGPERKLWGAGFSDYVPPGASGMPPFTPDPASPLNRLTSRQWEVLALAAEGMENGEIAVRMGVSKHTIACHISRMLDELLKDSMKRNRGELRIMYLEAREHAEKLRAAEEKAKADEIERMLGEHPPENIS